MVGVAAAGVACGVPWRPDVLDRWVGRLAAGMSAAATHGVIRTAHAARALGRRETPECLAELTRGLACWAAAYEELRWWPRPRRRPATPRLLRGKLAPHVRPETARSALPYAWQAAAAIYLAAAGDAVARL